MSNSIESVTRRVDFVPDPAAFVRRAEDSITRGKTPPAFWRPSFFDSAQRGWAAEPLPALSALARHWAPVFRANPALDPEAELKDLILADESLTRKDKREFEKFWGLSAEVDGKTLIRETQAILRKLPPAKSGEAEWRKNVPGIAQELKRIISKPGGFVGGNPALLKHRKRLFDLVFGYLRATWALEKVREERIRFAVMRLKLFRSMAGVLEGPEDLAERHTDYASRR